MEYRGIVKICQVGHILAFLVFRWVDLGHQVLLEVLGLYSRNGRTFIVYINKPHREHSAYSTDKWTPAKRDADGEGLFKCSVFLGWRDQRTTILIEQISTYPA